jgi:hypothetical protein
LQPAYGKEAFLGANGGGADGTLTTEAHGTTYKFDKQGNIVQYSKDDGKDVFKYSSQTGEYQEYVWKEEGKRFRRCHYCKRRP